MKGAVTVLGNLLVPSIYVVQMVMLFLGPVYFPFEHLVMLVLFFSLFLLVGISHLVKALRSLDQMSYTLDYEEADLVDEERLPQMNHIVIIPSYKEAVGTLRLTLDELCRCGSSSLFTIVLAMEAADPDHELTYHLLKTEYHAKFSAMFLTVHPRGVEGEMPGKGSNINYAARCISDLVDGRRRSNTVVTVCDADTLIPGAYFAEVEARIQASMDDETRILCAPFHFFIRNAHEVPAAVRMTDVIWSMMVFQNLSNPTGAVFPCSTYSMTLDLVEEVGFWDPGPEAIGEDMHMFIKAFQRCNVRGVPIYIPVLNTNIQTGKSYFHDLWARFGQATRHHLGVADLIFSMHRPKHHALGRWAQIIFHVAEAHVLSPCMGITGTLALPIYELLGPTVAAGDPIEAWVYAARVVTAMSVVPLLLILLVYEVLHWKVCHKLGSKNYRSLRNAPDYLWLPFCALAYMTLPAITAGFQRLFNRVSYTPAPKPLTPAGSSLAPMGAPTAIRSLPVLEALVMSEPMGYAEDEGFGWSDEETHIALSGISFKHEVVVDSVEIEEQ